MAALFSRKTQTYAVSARMGGKRRERVRALTRYLMTILPMG